MFEYERFSYHISTKQRCGRVLHRMIEIKCFICSKLYHHSVGYWKLSFVLDNLKFKSILGLKCFDNQRLHVWLWILHNSQWRFSVGFRVQWITFIAMMVRAEEVL